MTTIHIPSEIFGLIFSFATVETIFNCLTINESAYSEAIKHKPRQGSKYIYTKDIQPILFTTNIDASKIIVEPDVHLFVTQFRRFEHVTRRMPIAKHLWAPKISGIELVIIPMETVRMIIFDHRCYDTHLHKTGTQSFSLSGHIKQNHDGTNVFVVGTELVHVDRKEIYIVDRAAIGKKVYLWNNQIFDTSGLLFIVTNDCIGHNKK